MRRSNAAEADAVGASSEGFSDIDEIMAYYEHVATLSLANEFYLELRHLMQRVAGRPESFAIRQGDLRRANLHRFPYHLLFRIAGDVVRILVVRHHSRHPSLGSGRR